MESYITCNTYLQIFGLTVLALGSSMPDIVTATMLGNEGKGDIVVSSSFVANVFDVTIG